MNKAVEKEDLLSLVTEQKETNMKLTELCLKQGRLFSAVETLTENQKEHHAALFDNKFGLKSRVQRIENYATATIAGGGIVASLVSFKEKIISWFN